MYNNKSIHLICRRDGITFEGLSPAPEGKNVYMSYAWAFPSKFDLSSLTGGWIYLHPVSKNAPSEFGGVIHDITPSNRFGKAHSDGYMVVFESRKEGRGQKWRGSYHGMAWTGGIVEANFEHETKDKNA